MTLHSQRVPDMMKNASDTMFPEFTSSSLKAQGNNSNYPRPLPEDITSAF